MNKCAEKRLKVETFRYKYHRVKKGEKSKLLDEFCRVTGYERKYATKLLSKKQKDKSSKKGKRGRKSKYDCPEFRKALSKLWFLTDQMCSKLLKESIPVWLPFYEAHYGAVKEDIRIKLLAISPRTIDRALAKTRAKVGKGKSGTKPGTMLREEIPISTECWNTSVPGYVEADTVAHCGGSLMGEFVNSLTIVDIATTWTEVRAIWNKGAHGTLEQIQDIQYSLPFKLLGFDCDCGGEFINHHLKRYLATDKVHFTRGRPYHKNDNAHVEQKNWTHARQVLGYQRLGHAELVPLINDVLKNEYSLLRNHFFPTFKLSQKIMVLTRHKRIYGDPITPYQRVLDSDHVPDFKKNRLIEIHQTLDPIQLRSIVERKLKDIFTLLKKLNNKHEAVKSA